VGTASIGGLPGDDPGNVRMRVPRARAAVLGSRERARENHLANKVIDRAKLPDRFAELYPAVRDYIATRCFGRKVDLSKSSGALIDDPDVTTALCKNAAMRHKIAR
jgi:hypothetical protein